MQSTIAKDTLENMYLYHNGFMTVITHNQIGTLEMVMYSDILRGCVKHLCFFLHQKYKLHPSEIDLWTYPT